MAFFAHSAMVARTDLGLKINTPPAVPANIVAPTIAAITGTPTEGDSLVVSGHGTWGAGGPFTFTYQWQRGGVNIGGATLAAYTLAPADVGANIRCVVTATNASGSDSAPSGTLGPVVAAPPARHPVHFGQGGISQP